MPLDNLMYTNHLGEYFYQKAIWYPKFVWWPKRCALSNQRMWLKIAYKGTAMWTGPGSPVFEYKWISKEDFLFARLAGKI